MPLHTKWCNSKCPGLKIAGQNLTAKFYGSKKDLKNWVKKVLCLLKTLKSKLNAVDERGANYAFSARHEQLPHKDWKNSTKRGEWAVQIMHSARHKSLPQSRFARCEQQFCILHGVSNSFARKSAPDPSPAIQLGLQRLYGSGKSAPDPSPGSTAVLQRLYGNGSSKSPGSTAAAASIKSLQQPSWHACMTPSTPPLHLEIICVGWEDTLGSFVKYLIFWNITALFVGSP